MVDVKMVLRRQFFVIGVILCNFNLINANVLDENRYLTENFFANLNGDPYLTGEELTESSIKFIEGQIDNYMSMIKMKYGISDHSVIRRSLPNEKLLYADGVYMFDEFVPKYIINATFSKDMQLFQLDNVWYACVLQSGQSGKDLLTIFKYEKMQFDEILHEKTHDNGLLLEVYSFNEYTFLVVAGDKTIGNCAQDVTIYQFCKDEKLEKIQTLHTCTASDLIIWEHHNELYLAITEEKNTTNGDIYKTSSPIYKWLGKHFDMVDQITTYNPKSITAFSIASSEFLAIANFQNDNGDTTIYSEIFKYDLETDKFKLHQKLLTKGANDVKYFYLGENNVQENFLVVANAYEIDSTGSYNHEINSIVYKYIDGYFIPFQTIKLNGALAWLPVFGPNGQFALLASCKFDTLKVFTYDGWLFVETHLRHLLQPAIYMHAYIFNDNPLIVIANENEDLVNLMELHFSLRNSKENIQNDMLEWCSKQLSEIELFNAKETEKIVGSSPAIKTENLHFTKPVSFENVTVESFHHFRADDFDGYIDEVELNNMNLMALELDEQLKHLMDIENVIENSIQTSKVNTLDGDLIVGDLELNDVFVHSLTSEYVNEIDVGDFSRGVININEDLSMDTVVFNRIKVDEVFVPKTINKESWEKIVHLYDNVNLNDVVVDGHIIFNQGVIIRGNLNGMTFNKSTIVLNNGDQVFTDGVTLENIKVAKVETRFFNRLEMSAKINPEHVLLANISELTVKDLVIGGLINDVDLPTLDKYVLRISGDQTLTGEYIFDNLWTNAIEIDGLVSGTVPRQFVSITEGYYEINQDVQFMDDLVIDDLNVEDRFNEIKVRQNVLDVLLRETPNVQHVTGHKQFHNVKLLNPIKLLGKIKSKSLENMNPVKMIDEELTQFGDYIFSGNITVEKLLHCHDINALDQEYSFGSIKRLGLKITEGEIPCHMEFSQGFNANALNADSINKVDPKSWIINGIDEVQHVRGSKRFLTDIHVTGTTSVVQVNGIHVADLETTILKTIDDQELTGEHHVHSIISNAVQSKNAKLGENLWQNVILSKNELNNILGTTTIENSLTTNDATINNFQVIGNINNKNFTNLLRDRVTAENVAEITGRKIFENITVGYLIAQGLDMDELPRYIKTSEVIVYEDVFLENAHVHNITFLNRMNGMSVSDFNKNWVNQSQEQLFNGKHEFDSMTIYGEAFVESDYINGICISDMIDNTVKVDEIFQFNDVVFEKDVISLGPVNLIGSIPGLDVDNIVTNNEGNLTVVDEIIFSKDVVIEGTLYVNGLVNDMRLEDLCEYVQPLENENPKKIIIKGNAYFTKGPSIKSANGMSLKNELDNIWLANRASHLTGYAEFNSVSFDHNVTIEGHVNEVQLDWLSMNYFSKTKDQIIAAHLDFTEGVNFNAGVSAPRATLDGLLYGTDLMEFVRTAILNGPDQYFENKMFLEICNIQVTSGEYLVNNLNLERDVMRYDVENFVTGKKTISNIISQNLLIQENAKVQNVDVLGWIQNGILKAQDSLIQGHCNFNGAVQFTKGLGLIGSINGVKFDKDSIMLLSKSQNINGTKIFFGHEATPTKFESIRLTGRVNDIKIEELLTQQVFKNVDTIFDSDVNLYGDVDVHNLNVDKLFNGVNVTNLICKLKDFTDLNTYYMKYAGLLNVSNIVKQSLQGQAYFLDDYKVIQDVNGATFLQPIKFHGIDNFRLAVLKNNSNTIDFYIWDSSSEIFTVEIGGMEIYPREIFYITTLKFTDDTYLFIEYKEGETFVGNILRIGNNGTIEILQEMPSNGTIFAEAFTLPDKNQECLIFIYQDDRHTHIFCVNKAGVFDIYQQLETNSPFKVTTIAVDNMIYIIVINAEFQSNEAHIESWKFDEYTRLFNHHQTMYIAAPHSVSAVHFKGVSYLAIASGHLTNAMYPGTVEIRRLNTKTNHFVHWQVIDLHAPISVHFAVLPKDELALYVLSDSHTDPLIVFIAEGISGFVEKITAATIMKVSGMSHFVVGGDNHFIVVQNEKGSKIIRALFKGHRYH